jgi:hypothetical protein
MSFVGGKLKLKGGQSLSGGVKKKKKSSKPATGDSGNETLDLVAAGSGGLDGDGGAGKGSEQPVKASLEGRVLPPRAPDEDRRTEAEKRHAERVRKISNGRGSGACNKGARPLHRQPWFGTHAGARP